MIIKKLLQIIVLSSAPILTACVFYYAPTSQSSSPETDRLTIIGTADLQGRLDSAPGSIRITQGGEKIEVAGGISRIAALIKQIKQETQNPVIVVSSGDDLMGSYFHQFSGKAIFGLIEQAGYEVLGLGNHEFDDGPGVLAEALDSINFTALCSDLETRDTVMAESCQPYLLRNYQGIRIGFFSLMTENFPVVTTTGKVKIRDNQVAVARDMIQLLRKQGAQVIIAVTHIGTDMDQKLAATVPGIDIIFGGHSHNYMNTLDRVNNTLIVNGGEKGSALVRLDVYLDKDSRVIPGSADYSLIPVTEDVRPDSEVEKQLEKYRRQLPPVTVLGRTEKEWDLTSATLRTRESSVADMVTDIIRNRFKVDVVLYNGGAFRGKTIYPPGPVTNTMLEEIDEFESTVYLITMQGKYIQQMLEHSASQIGTGGFLQVSGIQFTIVTEAPAQQLFGDKKKGYFISQPGNRIRDIRIQSPDGSWQPLDPNRNYRLAANDFMVKMGGDRYFWFKKYGTNINNTYSTMGSVITDYLRRHEIVNPEKPDGRITIR